MSCTYLAAAKPENKRPSCGYIITIMRRSALHWQQMALLDSHPASTSPGGYSPAHSTKGEARVDDRHVQLHTVVLYTKNVSQVRKYGTPRGLLVALYERTHRNYAEHRQAQKRITLRRERVSEQANRNPYVVNKWYVTKGGSG